MPRAADYLKGSFIEFNEAFRRISGYAENEPEALDFSTLTPEQYQNQDAVQLRLLNQTGHYGLMKRCTDVEGALVPVRLNGMFVMGEEDQKYT